MEIKVFVQKYFAFGLVINFWFLTFQFITIRDENYVICGLFRDNNSLFTGETKQSKSKKQYQKSKVNETVAS